METKRLFESFRRWHQEQEVLEEVKLKDVKKQYPEHIDAIDAFAKEVDNKYLPWLMKRYVHRPKQKDRFILLIKQFDELSQNKSIDRLVKKGEIPKEAKDINYWNKRKLSDLQAMLQKAEALPSGTKKRKEIKGDVEKVYEDEDILVVSPLTHHASCFYGKGTKWCITSKDNADYWDQYTNDGFFFQFVINPQAEDERYKKIAFVSHVEEEKYENESINGYFFQVYDAQDDAQYGFAGSQRNLGEKWDKVYSIMKQYVEKRRKVERKKKAEKIRKFRARGWVFKGDVIEFTKEFKERLYKEGFEVFKQALADKWSDEKREKMIQQYGSVEKVYDFMKDYVIEDAWKNFRKEEQISPFFKPGLVVRGFDDLNGELIVDDVDYVGMDKSEEENPKAWSIDASWRDIRVVIPQETGIIRRVKEEY